MTYATHLASYRERLRSALDALDLAAIAALVEQLEVARLRGKTVFLFGNGGSASTASHFTCDLSKGVSSRKDSPFRAICLNDNLPALMAWANDVSYEEIFVGPLRSWMRPGDLVVAISGSGNSPNVLRAVEWANENGGLTVGLCGYGGGRLKEIARLVVHVAVEDMQVVEDLHLAVGHMAAQALCGGEVLASVGRPAKATGP